MTSPQTILAMLNDADDAARDTIARSIDTGLLDQWLSSRNWKIRNDAVKIIGELKLRDYTGVLIEMLTDRKPAKLIDRIFGGDFYQVGFIRRNAATALGKIGEPGKTVETALLTALNDPYWEVRTAAIKACAMIFTEGVPDALMRALAAKLDDRVFDVVAAAVRAANNRGAGKDILPRLRKLYDHPNSLVKLAVISTIRGLFERGVITDRKALESELRNIFVPGSYQMNANSM